MTEQQQQQPSAYEQTRDSVGVNEARILWRDGDRWAEHRQEQLARIDADETLSPEGKQLKAEEVLERTEEKVNGNYRAARAKLTSAAENAYKLSVPMPNGRTLAEMQIKDNSEMRAVQAEAAAIEQRLQAPGLQGATQAVSKHPGDKGIQAADSTMDVLGREFDSAMAEGAIEGRTRALAIKRIAEARRIDIADIADHHRTDRHRNTLASAEEMEIQLASLPSGKAPVKNPFEGRRGTKSVGTYGTGNRGVMATSGTGGKLFPSKRRPSWK